jgi:hypothetical protein
MTTLAVIAERHHLPRRTTEGVRMSPTAKSTKAATKPGDHKILVRLTPAEERALKKAYPQTGGRRTTTRLSKKRPG